MSFASFVTKLGDGINKGIRTVTDSKIIPNTIGKATRAGLEVGKVAGNVGFKAGAIGMSGAAEGVDFVRRNGKDIAKSVGRVGSDIGKELNTFAHAGLGAVEFIDRSPIIEKVGLDKSLIGRRFTKAGVGLFAAGSFVSGAAKSGTEYINDRQGKNDGQIYRPTPQIDTPYQLSQQMAYSTHGQSFANNAGATGDLVFALNDMRNG